MARLWALVTLSMSPVSPREKAVRGIHCDSPPPAALPLILNVGPPEGCRIAPVTFLPLRASPGTNPIDVVVLPSPRGVGVMAVTSMYFAFGRSLNRSRTFMKSILPSVCPMGINSSFSRPISSANWKTDFMSFSTVSAICQSAIFVGSRPFSAIDVLLPHDCRFVH